MLTRIQRPAATVACGKAWVQTFLESMCRCMESHWRTHMLSINNGERSQRVSPALPSPALPAMPCLLLQRPAPARPPPLATPPSARSGPARAGRQLGYPRTCLQLR